MFGHNAGRGNSAGKPCGRKVWTESYDQGVPRSIDYPEVLLYQFLDEAASEYPENNAIIFMGQKVSYKKLAGLINRFAAALSHLGVRKGDRIAFLFPTAPSM